MELKVEEYICEDASNPYKQWFDSLPAQAAAKMTVAKLRMTLGNPLNELLALLEPLTAKERSGHPIAKPNEIPMECGVMVFQNNQFEVTRMAPKRTVSELPFSVWMAMAKATPRRGADLDSAQVTLTCG